jgi:hypothetical protein
VGEKIDNKIICINSKEFKKVQQDLYKNEQMYVVELNGQRIQSWENYITEMQTKFKFPTSCIDSIDRYFDWIRDLDWLNKESYALIINDYDLFMKNNVEFKNEIISDFRDVILPFWQDEVEEVVVGGKAKCFTIYLVD